MSKPELCKCNCHQEWWEGKKHENCDQCFDTLLHDERVDTVNEIRKRLGFLPEWNEFGVPSHIEAILKDAEK